MSRLAWNCTLVDTPTVYRLANFSLFISLASYSRKRTHAKEGGKEAKGAKDAKGGKETKGRQSTIDRWSGHRVKTAAMLQTLVTMALTIFVWCVALSPDSKR